MSSVADKINGRVRFPSGVVDDDGVVHWSLKRKASHAEQVGTVCGRLLSHLGMTIDDLTCDTCSVAWAAHYLAKDKL